MASENVDQRHQLKEKRGAEVGKEKLEFFLSPWECGCLRLWARLGRSYSVFPSSSSESTLPTGNGLNSRPPRFRGRPGTEQASKGGHLSAEAQLLTQAASHPR